MSIIYDALKKVQTDLKEKKPQEASPKVQVPQPQADQNHPLNRTPRPTSTRTAQNTWHAPILFALAIFIFASALIYFLNYARRPPLLAEAPLSSAKNPGPPMETDPRTNTPPVSIEKEDILPEGTLKINGVMVMGNKNIVLINDEIYEIGDVINGMEIKDISLDKIQVLQDGQLKIIKVKRQ